MPLRTSIIVVSCIACLACSSSEEKKPSHSRDLGDRDSAADGASEPADAAALADAEMPADAAAPTVDAALVAPAVCDATAPLTCPDPTPHWSDVYPIFMRRCVACHNGAGGEWPLSQYEHVADWYGEIRAQMLACTMPPVTAGIDMPLEERQTILDWIRCDFPK